MKIITMDLELSQPSNKIIQIGAVLVHLNSEQAEIKSEFNEFVNPQEPLSGFIINLTGIRQEYVDSAKTFPEVFQAFETWKKENKPHLLVAWGSDWAQLYKEAGRTPPNRVLDLKMVYNLLNATKIQSQQARGLLGAIRQSGLEFQGRQHDALVDAKNTSYLMIDMIKRNEQINHIRNLLIEGVRK